MSRFGRINNAHRRIVLHRLIDQVQTCLRDFSLLSLGIIISITLGLWLTIALFSQALGREYASPQALGLVVEIWRLSLYLNQHLLNFPDLTVA